MIFAIPCNSILRFIKADIMDKRKIRDILRLGGALCFSVLYVPHLICYATGGDKIIIDSDLHRLSRQLNVKLPLSFLLLYLLHNNSYYRSLFYYRIGPVKSMMIGWYRPGNKYFSISYTTKIGKGVLIAHPYSTIINAESIGDNFSCIHLTTIGETSKGRPTIGNNVSLGASVTIIGNVHIGDNVIVGAGSVVVKDVPDNCIAAGNPAKVIRFLK